MRISGTTGTVLALVALAALGGGTYFFRTVQENRRLELQARTQQDRLKTKEAEARAKEAEAKTKESEARKAEADRKRAEAAAEEKRAVVAVKRQEEARAREQAAAATAAAKKATAEKAAADAAAKKAVAEKAASDAARAEQEKRAAAEAVALRRAEAERKAAAEKAAKEAELKRLREQVAAEKAAREQAEEKAVRAEKRAAYLANPDPDERPAPKKLVARDPGKDVTEAPAASAQKAGARKEKKELTGRPAVITADRTDYDRKEGVILFDRNVAVDDEQYQMHAERLFVFLDGTNDMKRLVALGNVAITNEDKSAWCAKAVYTKAASRIVMYGDERNPAWLRDAGGRPGDASEVRGLRITYWIDSGLATVEKSVITLPGLKGTNNPKDLFNPGAKKSKDE